MAYDFSDNIQRGIINLFKSNKDFYLQIVNLVKPEYFEYPSHMKMFEVVDAHYKKYHKLPTDDFVLQDIKKKLGAKEDLSDYSDELAYINNLDSSTKTLEIDLTESSILMLLKNIRQYSLGWTNH